MSLIRSFLRQRDKSRKATSHRKKLLFEPLEPRLLLDGTGLDSDPFTNPMVHEVAHDNGAIELIVDFSSERVDLAGELNENTLSGLGLASPISFKNADILTLILGSGADTLKINGTSVDTTVIAGPGDDSITTTGSGNRTTVSGNEGDDTLTLILDDLGDLSSSPFVDLGYTVETLRLVHTGTSPVDWRVEDGCIFAGNLLIVDTLGADALTIVGNGPSDTLNVVNGDSDPQAVTIESGAVQVEHGVDIFLEESQGFLTHPNQAFSIAMSSDGLNVYSVNSQNGTVMIFNRDGTGNLVPGDGVIGPYSEQGKLTVSTRLGQENILFGGSVDIDGDMAVVGARFDGGGSAYIFQEVGPGNWQKVAKLAASDSAGGDYFGYSVAISEDLAIVGALYGDGNVKDSGSAYVFKETSPGVWEQVAKLIDPDGGQYNYFGNSVAIDGDTVIIGAKSSDSAKGSAWIFQEIVGNWEMIAKLMASDGANGDNFGQSVAIDGDTVIIGAGLDDTEKGYDSGSAYIFREVSPGTWEQVTKLTASDGADSDLFGYSVGIDGGMLIVGAQSDTEGNDVAKGSAYIFQELSFGNWQEAAKLNASDGTAYGYFGQSLAIDSGRILVGARGDACVFTGGVVGVESLAISPEGDHVYVVQPGENAVTVFSRNPATGGLAFVQEVRDTVYLQNPDFMKVSPDGALAYVATGSDVSVFGIDKTSGELTFKKFIDTDGLGRPTSIEVSSDSQFVYIAGDANKLRTYSRTEFDHNIVADVVVFNPSSLALSPEGENLYIARKADNAISVFARNPVTGALTFIEEVKSGVKRVRGIEGVSSLVVTDDYVFATGENDDSLVAFKRDDEGRLSFTQRFKNRSGGVQRLENPNSVTISPDGKWIYVGSSGDETAAGGVAWFGILPTPQPATPLIVHYSDIEKLTVKTGSGDDIIRVAGAKLEAGSQVDVDGGDGEDTLFFDPDGNPITPQLPKPHSGDVKVFGSDFGTVHYQNVESIPGFWATAADAGPIPTSIYEGDSLTLVVFAVPGTNREIISVAWDLNGNDDFGDVVITDLQFDKNTNTYTAATTLPWADLCSYGLNDGDVPDGTPYELNLRAFDNIGDFAEDTVSLIVKNTAPTVDIKADASVNEGTLFVLALNAEDPGEDTVTQYIVYWGDGVVESFMSAGEVTHTYADNYENLVITVDLEDEDGTYENAGSLELQVANVAPLITELSLDQAEIDENGVITLTGMFSDPGTLDTHMVTIDWGDGNSEPLPLGVDILEFSASHQYLDDNPTGTPSDVYNISVTMLDDDMGSAIAATELKIDNTPPEIISVSVGPPLMAEGGSVHLNCAFTDPGTLDTWNATIDWGDGTATEIAGLSADLFESTHTYTHGGIYEITLNLSDDDMGTTTDTANVMVTGAGLVDGVLYVAGTSSSDWVQIDKTCFLLDRCHVRTFNAKEIERIEIYLGDGNDRAQVADNIKLPVLMDGGTGNDRLVAGRGPTMIIGGEGNDRLVGGCAGDKIYGGAGNDLIIGNGGNDIIFGGDGKDWIYGGSGNDLIDGGNGNDKLFGDSGNDLIYGGEGNDLVLGGIGNDVIYGGPGNDRLFGSWGKDEISGGDGNDLLVGGPGKDGLDGGGGQNQLIDWSCGLKDFKLMENRWVDHKKFHSCSSWVKDFICDLAGVHHLCNSNRNIQVMFVGPNEKPIGSHKGCKR
jgi:Ca2+-binding RTX toxin-like protein